MTITSIVLATMTCTVLVEGYGFKNQDINV